MNKKKKRIIYKKPLKEINDSSDSMHAKNLNMNKKKIELYIKNP